jgi:hypothetical protein
MNVSPEFKLSPETIIFIGVAVYLVPMLGIGILPESER